MGPVGAARWVRFPTGRVVGLLGNEFRFLFESSVCWIRCRRADSPANARTVARWDAPETLPPPVCCGKVAESEAR